MITISMRSLTTIVKKTYLSIDLWYLHIRLLLPFVITRQKKKNHCST